MACGCSESAQSFAGSRSSILTRYATISPVVPHVTAVVRDMQRLIHQGILFYMRHCYCCYMVLMLERRAIDAKYLFIDNSPQMHKNKVTSLFQKVRSQKNR
jgi:hypothetical protein